MKLSVHSLNQTLFDGSASRITAKTTVGELTILDNHIPLLVPLVSGLLRIGLHATPLIQGANNAETTFSIQHGFLEVKPGSGVIILADATKS